MTNPLVDTASQRGPTGLNQGARELILRLVSEVTSWGPLDVVGALFKDRYGGRSDYLDAVEEVRGWSARNACEEAMANAEANAEFPTMTLTSRVRPEAAAAYALLIVMPEADFRLAVEEALRAGLRMGEAAPRITEVLRARGTPWVFSEDHGFEWVGDALVEELVVDPAVSALSDPRFAGGVKSEFDSARNELRADTPVTRKQAVYEAGCSVESAMKVVLDEHGAQYAPTDAAQALFNHLVSANIVPRYMEREVLGAATPRNKTAGHGAGAIPHDVSTEEAEGVVAAAAGAIGYLAKKLP